MVLASAVILYKDINSINFEKIIFFVFGFLLAYIIVGASALQVNHSLPIILISGAVAICAMILPGISGAFILLLLNQYEFLISTLHAYNLPVIGTFLVGALGGILSFSKLLDYILQHFKFLMFSFLIGVMVGSLRTPLERIMDAGPISLLIIFVGIGGFILVFALESVFYRKKQKP